MRKAARKGDIINTQLQHALDNPRDVGQGSGARITLGYTYSVGQRTQRCTLQHVTCTLHDMVAIAVHIVHML